MKRIALALAAVGLVGLMTNSVWAAPPTALAAKVAVATVAHGPGHHGPGHHWHGHHGHHHWYRPPVVIAPRPPVIVAPPAYYPYSPYYVPGTSIYYGSPRFSIGLRF